MEQRARRGSVTQVVAGRTAGSPSLSLSYSQLSSHADCIPPSFPLRLPLVSHELEVGQLCSRSLFIMLIGLRATISCFCPLAPQSELVLFFLHFCTVCLSVWIIQLDSVHQISNLCDEEPSTPTTEYKLGFSHAEAKTLLLVPFET